MSDTIAVDVLRRMPKVLLHDHLDGGLRPETVIELAADAGVEVPTTDPAELRDWFFRGANRGSLAEYLEGFGVTCSVLQTTAALERAAFELIEDMHADGVVYTEVRFAPILHVDGGLNLEQVMNAVIKGLREGRDRFGVGFGVIVCALRNMPAEISLEMAELAVAFRDEGVVGFDLAGDESGHPPKRHLDAFHYCRRQNFNITIHAGEAFGASSIWQALQYCGAQRIGHCTRLVEDMVIHDGAIVEMGTLASYVRDRRIPLEVCLQSNVHTGAARSLEEHPFRYFLAGNFRVTLNTDNRLMSNTSMTDEFRVANEVFGLDALALEKLTVNAMKSAFIGFDERIEIIYDRVKAGYAKLWESGVFSAS